MTSFDLTTIGRGLPAADLAPRLRALAGPAGCVRAVVEAPPGTGKTTVVPPLLAQIGSEAGRTGRVLVTQPRRVAARSAARRLAQLTGTRPGELAGHTVRGERTVAAGTRVEFVTTGVLLRRMVQGPELAGVDAVVLDEVHERHLDSDLAFAMLRQLAELREDLSLVAMSATVDAARWSQLLGTPQSPAPVAAVPAEIHPLTERWAPAPEKPLDARGTTPAFLEHVGATVAEAAAAAEGDVLVFLPGAREIDRVAGILARRSPAPVLVLTGRTPAAEQDRVLDPRTAGGGRVVLATNVAESALTVPGVRTVVDAGLDRQQRLDTVRGMSGLVTVGASKAAMVQRAGRAAREAPGTVVRCLSSADFAARPAATPPEITTSDLTSAVLDLACWGAPGGTGLALPDPLPERPMALALRTLESLGALDAQGRATDLGHRLATVPADPRLARALFDGAELVGARAAAEVVAAIGSDQHAPGGDLWALLRQLRREKNSLWRSEVQRLERLVSSQHGSGGSSSTAAVAGAAADEAATGLVTALAFPDRVARARSAAAGGSGAGGSGTGGSGAGEYLLASGTGADLPRDSGLRGQPWLAVAEVALLHQRPVVRAAAAIDQDTAELAASSLLVSEEVGTFGKKVSARQVTRLGSIELSSTPCAPSAATAREAVAQALAERGLLEVLQPGPEFEALRGRLGMLHRVLGSPWPDVSEAALAASATDWLGPELERMAAGTPASRVDAVSALRRLLPWPEAARLEELAPERLEVPSGARIRLDWPAPEQHPQDPAADPAPPVLAVKLQECFGWAQGPRVCQGRVPVQLHLLSPARRPLAVTQDLTSFWDGVYPQVRAENRNKYKKHPWPEDPWHAVATALTKNRLEGR